MLSICKRCFLEILDLLPHNLRLRQIYFGCRSINSTGGLRSDLSAKIHSLKKIHFSLMKIQSLKKTKREDEMDLKIHSTV